jgi:hypothetical protein
LVTDWTVLSEINSASDHDYIEFMVNDSRGSHHNPFRRPETASGWAVKKLSTEKLSEYWNECGQPSILDNANADDHAAQLQKFLFDACEAAMPCRTVFKGRRAMHWWSDAIAVLRAETIAARRQYQRAGRRANQDGRTAAFEVYNQKRKDLRTAIRWA